MKTSWKLVGLGLLLVAIAPAENDASKAFIQMMSASMIRMDHDISAAPMNGNIDQDFAAMMISHPQGAVDMAKAELSYGKDPVMHRLAQEIIVDSNQ